MSFARNLWLTAMLIGMLHCAPAGTLAQFRTELGDLEVELYDLEKPVTVSNFKRLVQSGAYENTFLHRVIPGFVAQGGGYTSLVPTLTNHFGPDWFNLQTVPNFGPITNEYGVGPFFSNTNGTLAMAKVGNNPNSATCAWFFNLGNNATNLDNQNGGFTVFGRVVRDTCLLPPGTLLGFLNQRSYGDGIVDMTWWYPNDPLATNLFKTLPVVYTGVALPRYSQFFYVDVSLLLVGITTTNNQRQISWNSVTGKTNYVEFTTVMPPIWLPFAATNGNGSRITITDLTTTNSMRFYRVRVDY